MPVEDKGILNSRQKDLLVEYVLSRKCGKGGFCFYRLDEPNSSDTYYALSILHALKIPFHDENTAEFLYRLGDAEGGFESVNKACYALNSLKLMNLDLPERASPLILRHIHKFSFSPDNLPPEITSMFKRLRHIVELAGLLKIRVDEETGKKMTLFVLAFQNGDGGFGYTKSSLSDTMEALLVLKNLCYPIETLGVNQFIQRCENEISGFTEVPGTSLSYIENIHDGLLSSVLVGYKPNHIDRCSDEIYSCQNRTGGYSRKSCTGIATLENSYYAIRSLQYIHGLTDISSDSLKQFHETFYL